MDNKTHTLPVTDSLAITVNGPKRSQREGQGRHKWTTVALASH